MAFSPINKMLVVHRPKRTITLYKRPIFSFRFKKKVAYEVAIGAKGHRTPEGLYLINTRAKNPEWMIPDSQWARDAGLKPGTIVPGGDPNNPIRERWLGITDPKEGVGIHGTLALDSIGTAASHGCIRMRPKEVIELYGMVPKYTPIVIF